MSNNTNNNNFSQYRINKISQNVNNSKTVSCIACNPKGEKPNIIVGFDDGMIKLFNFDVKGKFTCIDILYEHDNRIICILFNPINPLVFLSCSIDNKIILWNLMNEELEWKEFFEVPSTSTLIFNFNYDCSILCYKLDNIIVLRKIIYYTRINGDEENKDIRFSLNIRHNFSVYNIIYNNLYFHPNNNLLYIECSLPEKSILIYSVDDSLNELTKLKTIELSSICNKRNLLDYDGLRSSLNMTGNILFLVVQSIKVLYILNEIGEYIKEYDLKEYFKEYTAPNIIPLFHPKNPELLVLYNYKNIIILQITSSRIKCLYRYRIKGSIITSCSFNFLGNAIILSSDNKLVILELKLNIVNNNHSNKKTNMMRMLGNISVSAS
jgi:WD40 repeat protein